MRLFKKKPKFDYRDLLSKLEDGDKNVINSLLWSPKNKVVNHLPISTELIQKLKAKQNTDKLKIHKKFQKGYFELIILEITYTDSDVPYSPIIIDNRNGKIIGIMLPFNELITHLTNKENKAINSLAVEWTSFVINHRLGK
nr:hypothetical protein [uncultured Psychroserpens sp.]